MRFSTDASLLGAWAELGNAQKVLDIGTGTGVLCLMAAQRHPNADFTALELDENACGQAQENFDASPWSNRISVICQDIRVYAQSKHPSFDAILCNPPYFENSTPSALVSKAQAKHTQNLDFQELLLAVKSLLLKEGALYCVLPSQAAEKFNAIAASFGLFPQKWIWVSHTEGKAPHRFLARYGFSTDETGEGLAKTGITEEKMYLYEADNKHSDAFKKLLQDYFIIW
jgi:tRNA1Val (adenine37-N6)-methyltransferase